MYTTDLHPIGINAICNVCACARVCNGHIRLHRLGDFEHDVKHHRDLLSHPFACKKANRPAVGHSSHALELPVLYSMGLPSVLVGVRLKNAEPVSETIACVSSDFPEPIGPYSSTAFGTGARRCT